MSTAKFECRFLGCRELSSQQCSDLTASPSAKRSNDIHEAIALERHRYKTCKNNRPVVKLSFTDVCLVSESSDPSLNLCQPLSSIIGIYLSGKVCVYCCSILSNYQVFFFSYLHWFRRRKGFAFELNIAYRNSSLA